MKKKSSKNDKNGKWQGMIQERTEHLIKTTEETKEVVEKLHDKLDEKFKELQTCVNSKFEKHNLHHEYVEKKYTKLFLVLGTLVIASILLNPESIKYLWIIVSKFIGLF